MVLIRGIIFVNVYNIFDDLNIEYIELNRRVCEKISEEKNKNIVLKNVFLDYITEKILETDCEDDLVSDMGFLLDRYDIYSEKSERAKDSFYNNFLSSMVSIFNNLNGKTAHIQSVEVYSNVDISIKKDCTNNLMFIYGQDKKEAAIYLFNYINREFVRGLKAPVKKK